jgi:hypothetical protein
MKRCTTPGCDGEVTSPNFDYCNNCCASIRRWNRRPTRDVIDRFNKLTKFQARMDIILPTNVVVKRYKTVKKPENMPGQLGKKHRLKKAK